MNLYSKARKHIDMSRVKELREEKIKEEKIAEALKQQEELLVKLKKEEIKEDPKYSNWRRELNEQMMTTDALKVTLPPQGNTNLDDFAFPVEALGSSPGTVQSGNDYTFGPASAGVPPAESSSISVTMNSEKYDTIVFDWVNSGVIDKFFAFTGSDGGSNTYNFSTSSGRKEIRLKPSDRKRSVSIAFNIQRNAGGGLGTNKILNVTFQRRTPVNVFVGLDSPEATSFIRDGQSDALSPNQKKKKIEDQLKAGSDYLDKMFGTNVMPKYATEIAEYEPQQSFMDIQAGGERITKQDGKTTRDTTRDIEAKPTPTPQPTPTPTPTPEPTPTSTKSAIPRFYRNLSAEGMGGAIQYASSTMKNGEEYLKNQFRGTDVNVSKLMSLGKELARLNHTYAFGGGTQSTLDRIKNTEQRIKAEIEGGKPDLKPVTQVPSSTENQAELEKNIEASLKQLEIDNRELKGSALKRNIGLAVDLGLDILTVVTLLTPIPGDEAVALTAQAAKAGVKTGAKTAAQKATIDAFKREVTDMKTLTRAQNALSRAPKGFKGDVAIPIKVQGKTINVKANEILRNKNFKIIGEKKSYNDLTKKIPGYYDGKPAPLGFPIEEPPKMKNGFHPDLVDGKKVAKRFNRLDPISAKAMPPTGNPHIDKKVRAAAKKPK